MPQLGATGIKAAEIKKETGFRVIWVPVRSSDLPAFMAAEMRAEMAMRRVQFTFGDRLVLIPVELNHVFKPAVAILVALLLLSGINGNGFSLAVALQRGTLIAGAVVLGITGGAILVPLLLPWLPGRAFHIKGSVAGVLLYGVLLLLFPVSSASMDSYALGLMVVAISSNLAMNFTGSTPYTSPSGVEKEMKVGIPFQAIAILASLILWFSAPFV